MPLAQLLEQYVSLGIFVLAAGLSVLSFLAWRRERDGRMRIVTLGYAMFAVTDSSYFSSIRCSRISRTRRSNCSNRSNRPESTNIRRWLQRTTR